MSDSYVELFYDYDAYPLLSDAQFLMLWRTLYSKCLHATVFQHPGFVCAWYETYQSQWKPIIVRSWNSNGDLTGLWLLAYDPSANALAHAGTRQAEYHVWLTLPGEDTRFLTRAWSEIKKRFDFKTLLFSFLPTWNLVDVLQTAEGMQGCVIAQKLSRPLLNLEPDEIKSTFAKKSNKSKFNRLNKLGKLEFRRLTDTAELEQVFDDLITYYDFRQGAINQSIPFQQDPYKRQFHTRVFASAPEETYVTVAFLDGRPISGFWGSVSEKTVHLGMIMNSPFLAEHSLGKLHIMQLSEHLLSTGKQTLDLTPGGTWKERFANASDDVAKVIVYRTPKSRGRAEVLNRLVAIGKQGSRFVGIRPANVKSTLAKIRSQEIRSTAREIGNWLRSVQEVHLYETDQPFAGDALSDPRALRNSLSDLILFDPTDTKQSRDTFLFNALERLESGESAYTVVLDNHLAFCGWVATHPTVQDLADIYKSATFPQNTIFLHDFYSHPVLWIPDKFRAVINYMLSQEFADKQIANVCVLVSAKDLTLRQIVESMGFPYRGSFLSESRRGQAKKWINTIPAYKAP